MRINKNRGFTLLELMIVVIVVAILATLAVYNYAKYGYRTRRADGKEMIQRVAAAEERYYTNFNQYTTTLSNLNFNGTSEKGYYLVTAANGTSGDAQTYKLTAAPQGIQANDVCGSLTLDNTGVQTPASTGMPQNSNGACW